METSVAARQAREAGTIAEAFRITAAQRADELAVRDRHGTLELTWGELLTRVDALAGGLAALGVQRGETVALMLINRPEFHLADLAVVTAGGTPFSIYQTYTADQIRYVVEDSGSKVIITEQAYLAVVLEARAQLPDIEHVIIIDPPDGGAPQGTIAL